MSAGQHPEFSTRMNNRVRNITRLFVAIFLITGIGRTGFSAGNTFTWDASGSNPAAPTDGAGTWSTANANWSNGTNDFPWSSGSSAIFGATNGAAGAIANSGVTVSNLTFNPAGSGGYIITGSTLTLIGNPTITVGSGVFATNTSTLAGTGFIKAGNGMFVLQPASAAQNVGQTVVNGGTLFLAAGGVNSLNDDLVVNSGAVVQVAQGSSIPVASRLFINGGNVTNMSTANTTENHNVIAFDNNGIQAASAISQLNVTNFDFRGGTEAFPKFPATMTTNFSVKSTPGTMIVQTRANSSGANGIAGLRINAGTFICDYPSPAPNNDAQGGSEIYQHRPNDIGRRHHVSALRRKRKPHRDCGRGAH